MKIDIKHGHRNNTSASKQHLNIETTHRHQNNFPISKKNMSTLIIFNPSKVERATKRHGVTRTISTKRLKHI